MNGYSGLGRLYIEISLSRMVEAKLRCSRISVSAYRRSFDIPRLATIRGQWWDVNDVLVLLRTSSSTIP